MSKNGNARINPIIQISGILLVYLCGCLLYNSSLMENKNK